MTDSTALTTWVPSPDRPPSLSCWRRRTTWNQTSVAGGEHSTLGGPDERAGPSLHGDRPDLAADSDVRRLLVAPAADRAAAERVPGGVLPGGARPRRGIARAIARRSRPAQPHSSVPGWAMGRRDVAPGRGPGAVRRDVRPHGHRQARAVVGGEHADQHRRRAVGRSAADDGDRGDRQLTALGKPTFVVMPIRVNALAAQALRVPRMPSKSPTISTVSRNRGAGPMSGMQKPVASTGLLGLRERPVQVARAGTTAGSL